MSKGYGLSQLVNGDIGGFRNKIINGNFDIWQRGPAFNTDGYTADRWLVHRGGATSTSVTRVEYSRGINYLGITRNGGTTAFTVSQRMEEMASLAGKTVTVTFDTVKSGTPLVGGEVYMEQYFGTGGSATKTTAVQLFGATTTQTRYRFKFKIPAFSFTTIGAGAYTSLVFSLPVALGGISALYISRVSVVIGDATGEADPFSPRHISQELAMCHRYYERVAVSARGYSPVTNGYFENTVSFVPKRALPAVTLISAPSELNVSAKLLAPYSNGYDHSSARFSVGSAAIGDVYSLGTIYALDAEL